jgi:hypothetical protein
MLCNILLLTVAAHPAMIFFWSVSYFSATLLLVLLPQGHLQLGSLVKANQAVMNQSGHQLQRSLKAPWHLHLEVQLHMDNSANCSSAKSN